MEIFSYYFNTSREKFLCQENRTGISSYNKVFFNFKRGAKREVGKSGKTQTGRRRDERDGENMPGTRFPGTSDDFSG